MGERAGRRIALDRMVDGRESRRVSEGPATRKGSGSGVPGRGNVGEWIRSSVVGLLLFSVVASSIAGAGTVLFCVVILAWTLFPLIVGTRDTLEAGCVFMLISLGVVVVVGLARYGPGAFTP